MPEIIIVDNPQAGDMLHFFLKSDPYIAGPFRIVVPGEKVMDPHTKQVFTWPPGEPCTVTPVGERVIVPDLEKELEVA
ncbi:MAG: hypothetical protein KQI81_08685 [Deltaproteobacteria bacterium]|nr:hypothetical protein [Deltaproteobacteria bacterium]